MVNDIAGYFDLVSSVVAWIVWFGIAIQLAGLACFLFFYFRKKPGPLPASPLPGVTLVKPCYGIEDGETVNFESFFNQKYPGPLELIFVVSEETDPSVPLIKSFIERYPHVDARLLISKTRKAYWQKIDAYNDAYHVAKHDLFIISDSDTFVNTDYVSQMVASLNEPGVSFVTVPQYDFGINNIPTAIKTLGNNCDVAVYVMLMNALVRKKTVAWGHSLGFRRSEFDLFGEAAWERLRHYFGDDLILPSLFSENGKKVVFRNIYCPVTYSGKTMAQMLHQQRRFAICQKVALGKWIFSLGVVGLPQIMATLNLLIAGFSGESIKLFFIVWAVRILVSLVFEGLTFKTVKDTILYFWTLPIWDLLKIYFVLSAWTKNEMTYHGRPYRIESDSRVSEVSEMQGTNKESTAS